MRLAPLDPDAFLRWAYRVQPHAKGRGTSPLTVDDLVWEYRGELTREDIRRMYVRCAARVRRNQRLDLNPFDGVR